MNSFWAIIHAGRYSLESACTYIIGNTNKFCGTMLAAWTFSNACKYLSGGKNKIGWTLHPVTHITACWISFVQLYMQLTNLQAHNLYNLLLCGLKSFYICNICNIWYVSLRNYVFAGKLSIHHSNLPAENFTACNRVPMFPHIIEVWPLSAYISANSTRIFIKLET